MGLLLEFTRELHPLDNAHAEHTEKKSLALKRPGILIVVRYLFKDYSAAASIAVSSA